MAQVRGFLETPTVMLAVALTAVLAAQEPTNNLPNPYTTIENHFKMP